MDELEEGREMSESITEELRGYAADNDYASKNTVCWFAYRIDERFTHELQSKQDEVDGLKDDNSDLQVRLDASMPLPVDADGVPCRIGDLLETEEHIPRKAVGYYLADESTPCVTLDFVSPSIEASRLHHVAPEPLDSQDRIDAEMAELPRSADGKSWTGREVCFWTGAEREEYHSFHDLVLRPEGWYVEDSCGNGYVAESVWYERPDSLERIADEIEDADVDGCIDWADRIRRLAKEEER